MQPWNHKTDKICCQYTVRAANKEAETLKDSFPESQPDGGFLYFYSAVLVNPCGFMLTGQCDGGTWIVARWSTKITTGTNLSWEIMRRRVQIQHFLVYLVTVEAKGVWQETWRGLKTTDCPKEGRLFTGWSRPCQRSPGRRTPCRGSHLGPAHVRTPQRWQPTQRPCCGRWPAGRKPGWSSAGGASWWGGGVTTWQSEERGAKIKEGRGNKWKEKVRKEWQVRGGEKRKWLEVYLMILMSSLMLTWSGTRNLVLSRMGSCFSPLYRSIITCRTHKRPVISKNNTDKRESNENTQIAILMRDDVNGAERGDLAVADWILWWHCFLTAESVVRPVSLLNCELVTGRGSHTYQMRVERGEDPITCIKQAF